MYINRIIYYSYHSERIKKELNNGMFKIRVMNPYMIVRSIDTKEKMRDPLYTINPSNLF